MKNILIYLDTDPQPSTFDQVVAYDAGADAVLAYSGVTAENCFTLVEGAIYTRAPMHKRHTAILIGGSNLTLADALAKAVRAQFFGNFQVSVALDANGCNTTAAAAVVTLSSAYTLEGSQATVLAGTGPVGQRAALMLTRSGCKVRLSSRKQYRAQQVCDSLAERYWAPINAVEASDEESTAAAIEGAAIVLTTGQTGVQLLSREVRQSSPTLRAAGDVGTCPPLGIEDLDLNDDGRKDGDVALFGGLAIGSLKLRTQRELITRLFERNDQFWDAGEILELTQELFA